MTSICRNGNAVSFINGFSEITFENFFLPKNPKLNAKYLYCKFDDWFVADLKKKLGLLLVEQVENSLAIT